MPLPWFRLSLGGLVLPTNAEVADFTVGQVTDIAVARDLLGTFDFALPQGWVDDVRETIREDPSWFVWSYPRKSIWGEPFPLTVEAAAQLAKYNEMRGARR